MEQQGAHVLPGIEVTTKDGDFGIYASRADLLKKFPQYLPSVEAIEKEPELFIVWLHPRSPSRTGWSAPQENGHLEKVLEIIDGIEVLNGKMLDLMVQGVVDKSYVKELVMLCDKYSKVKIAGSDAHARHQLGVCWTIIPADELSPANLIAALKQGDTALGMSEDTQRMLSPILG